MTKFDPTGRRHHTPDFGRAHAEHVEPFLGIMNILHSESVAPAFGRLLRKSLQPDDYVQLAHVFEEISVLALHHLIPETLLYDAFAFDLYWDEVREDVISNRLQTGNEKFCENFELAAERARAYRADRPPKMSHADPRASIRCLRRAAVSLTAPVRRLLRSRIRSRSLGWLRSGAKGSLRDAEQAPHSTSRLSAVAGREASRTKR